MHLIPKFIKYCQWHNGPEGWGLATPRNHIFSEAYHPSWPPCPSPYSPVQPSTAHQPFWCCQTCNHSFPLSNYIVYIFLLLINISNSNNPTALSEHCCTPTMNNPETHSCICICIWAPCQSLLLSQLLSKPKLPLCDRPLLYPEIPKATTNS